MPYFTKIISSSSKSDLFRLYTVFSFKKLHYDIYFEKIVSAISSHFFQFSAAILNIQFISNSLL